MGCELQQTDSLTAGGGYGQEVTVGFVCSHKCYVMARPRDIYGVSLMAKLVSLAPVNTVSPQSSRTSKAISRD